MKRMVVMLTVVALMVVMLAPSALAAHPYWYTQSADGSQQSWSRYRHNCSLWVSSHPGWTPCTKVDYAGDLPD